MYDVRPVCGQSQHQSLRALRSAPYPMTSYSGPITLFAEPPIVGRRPGSVLLSILAHAAVIGPGYYIVTHLPLIEDRRVLGRFYTAGVGSALHRSVATKKRHDAAGRQDPPSRTGPGSSRRSDGRHAFAAAVGHRAPNADPARIPHQPQICGSGSAPHPAILGHPSWRHGKRSWLRPRILPPLPTLLVHCSYRTKKSGWRR